jgi:hypothetical protein
MVDGINKLANCYEPGTARSWWPHYRHRYAWTEPRLSDGNNGIVAPGRILTVVSSSATCKCVMLH